MTTLLSKNELADLASRQPAWSFDASRKALHRRLVFTTFGEALAAMVRIGVEADKADHHPEWSNVFGTIDIWLTTHDSGGVSAIDRALAELIDGMYPHQEGGSAEREGASQRRRPDLSSRLRHATHARAE